MTLPDETKPQCALLLRNIHQVMKAEDVLHKTEFGCDLVPVPRDISSECGMAVVIACDDAEAVEALLADAGLDVQALYANSPDGAYTPVFDRRNRA